MLGLMLQEMTGFKGLFECQTLLGLVQFPSTILRVGIPGGRASCMSNSWMVSIRGSIK